MANIQYSSINNTCFGTTNGIAQINQINFNNQEAISYESYTIVWNNLNNEAIISPDGRTVSNLANGLYSFEIDSLINAESLGPYEIEITSPPQLSIVSVEYDQYSCGGDATATIVVSGGVPPYSVSFGSYYQYTSNTNILFENIKANTYSLRASDNNNCFVDWPNEITISDSTILAQVIETIPPTLMDGYGIIKFKATGYGPFSLSFKNLDTQAIILLSSLSGEEYITNITNNIYEYKIDDILVPGDYELTISNTAGCSQKINITIPNIQPLFVTCDIGKDIPSTSYSQHNILPIFDIVLIPYSHIQNNSSLWQYIQTVLSQDTITFKVNNINKNFRIININEYISQNQIPILRLGEDSTKWFFYFRIAPGINTQESNNFTNSTYSIIDSDNQQEFPVQLGLNNQSQLESNNASLIRGSFILSGTGYDQFSGASEDSGSQTKNLIYVTVGKNNNIENYDYSANITTKITQKNVYSAGFTTTITVLEESDKLNTVVTIGATSSSLSEEEQNYLLNIYNLLITLNSFNNLSNIYIYNFDSIKHTGKLSVFLEGNTFMRLENYQSIANPYDIEYYILNIDDDIVKTFYQNNNSYNNNLLLNLTKGYIIIRIKDNYNNKPKYIKFNNSQINDYDDHFAEVQQTLSGFGPNISSFFQYGDILAYIPSIEEVPEPSPIPITPQPILVVPQTNNTSNTASLSINLLKPNIKCYLSGPQNYSYTIIQNTKFTNMIPGLYTIIGDSSDLMSNFLYQNKYKLLINNNTTNNIDINFTSYQNQLLIRNLE